MNNNANLLAKCHDVEKLLHKQHVTQAAEIAAKLIKQYADDASSWQALSMVAEATKNAALACKAALKAVSLAPDSAIFLVQLARAYLLIGQSGKALIAAQKAYKMEDLSTRELDKLGVLFFKCGENELSVQCHQINYQQQPENIHFISNYASALFVMGDFELTEKLYEKLLVKNPLDCTTHLALSQVRKVTEQNNHIDSFKAALVALKNNDAINKHQVCYALAKEYEDLKEYESSFKYLEEGAKARRSIIDYKESETLSAMDQITQLPPSFFQNTQQSFSNEEAIFVVGLPRSGTTLVEQIIASHSEVFAAGELHNFNLVMHHLVNYYPKGAPLDNQLIYLLNKADMAQLGNWYIESTRPRTSKKLHFIDKLPSNSLFCGYIHKALPNAKIILLDREPMDVCYANYKMNFKHGYDYSYQLDELGRYYVVWKQLMDYWQQTLPSDRFYRISYESLVENQDVESRRLVEFCGLEWQEECLEFYKNKQGVATASAAQVRQPIYKTSVAKWKAYKEQLRPLIHILKQENIETS